MLGNEPGGVEPELRSLRLHLFSFPGKTLFRLREGWTATMFVKGTQQRSRNFETNKVSLHKDFSLVGDLSHCITKGDPFWGFFSIYT